MGGNFVDNSCSTVIAELVQLAPHTEIAHHIPGRIRLKVLISGIEVAQKSHLENLAEAIPGIRNVEVKRLSRSVIIDYDKERLPCEFWEKLMLLKHKPELAGELEKVICTDSKA